MLLEQVAQTADVTHEGKVVSVPYYVENGFIHAHIDGRAVRLVLGSKPADITITAVLGGLSTVGAERAADSPPAEIDIGRGHET